MMRSMLFLPGNNPNLIGNGDILGADAVIFDLEDAVSADQKDAARILVRNALGTGLYANSQVIVRINAADDTGLWKRDLEELVPLRPNVVMPTKVSGRAYVAEVEEFLGGLERRHGLPEGTIRLLPLIETALGLENAYQIASASPRVTGIFLGAEDLTTDLQCARTKGGREILWARCRMVCAARAAGVEVYDTPFTDVYDDQGLLADLETAKGLGFSGKASISPRHVEAINQCFTPTQAEIDYAHEVVEAIELARSQGKGAISLRGKMIDAPIVARARRVLETERALAKGGRTDE